MDQNEEIKKHSENLLSGLQGITMLAKSAIEKSLEELQKSDPKKAEEQARIYAQALGSGTIDQAFKDITKQFQSMNGAFNGY